MFLESLFDSLATPADNSSDMVRFTAVPIPGCEQHRLGKDLRGYPLLLVSVTDTVEQARPSPIVLQHLTVQHGLECRISRPDGSVERGRFTVIRCTGADRALITYFLHVIGTVVASLSASPFDQDVSQAIDKLVELFRAMTELPRKSVQGLWAELYCMARIRQPILLLRAWHSAPEDKYDFRAGGQRVEVKSASGSIRQHFFSLEQLHPPLGTQALIASLFVERSSGGISITQLADRIRTLIADEPKLLLHLDRVIGLTLGENWRSAIEDRFDQQLAEQSLLFYNSEAIPTICPDLPPGVSLVRFMADLTGCAPVDVRRYREQGGLFQALLVVGR
jgi:hypothetical protein